MIANWWRNSFLVSDVLNVPWRVPDQVFQCMITSPPYWGQRTYGTEQWKGGDVGCQHTVIRRSGDQDKSATNRGSSRDRVSNTCRLCGATRIDQQIGLEKTPEEYIAKIVKVFREIWRVLRKDGTVFLNMGDSYAGSGGAHAEHHVNPGISKSWKRDGVPHWGRLRQPENYLPPSGLKTKDLCGIPWRLAFALQADGWWLRRDIIWNKPNPMPESVTDRPTSSHEYIFLLTKSGTSQYWTHREKDGVRSKPKADWRWVNQITGQEVAEAPLDWKEIIVCPECNGKGKAQIDCGYEIMGEWFECWQENECPTCKGKKKVQRWKRVNLWRGHDYFYDHDAVREPHTRIPFGGNGGYAPSQKDSHLSPQSAIRENRGRMGNSPSGRNLRSVWTFATKPYKKAHFATFPPELPRRCILAGTSEKGACPECGAPWERVTEKKKLPRDELPKEDPRYRPHRYIENKYANELREGYECGMYCETQSLGWRPTCSCGHKETVPCAVLDPFVGSGTTAEVAIDLDRDFFGIDLNRNYLKDFARPRIDEALKRQRARQAQGVLNLKTV